MIEFRAVDCMGNLYKVTDLRDVWDRPTTNVLEAEFCVVHSMGEKYLKPTDEVPVYPVN